MFGFARMFKRKGKREREKLGDRKTCRKGELQLTYITTMVKLDLQNKSMLKLHVSLYIKVV